MTGYPVERALRSFAFGPFILIPERQLLLEGDTPVRIGCRALDILTALVENPGELMSKRELLSRGWPNVIVEESNLKVNMAGLRRALREGPGAPRYIATVIGRGYRFVASVQSCEAGALPAGFAPPPRRHNLPHGTTRIVGRADAIDAARREIAQARLVSIVGPGGVGKTTVALAVAERALDAMRDGVWLVDLAPIKDPALVANAVATAVGLAVPPAHLASALRDRAMLLLFDNCEHLIDAAADCAERILAEAAEVRILATSREPLRVRGEHLRRLPGLATPRAPRPNAAEALAFPAVQLFVERAAETLESFELRDADAPLVAEICRRLDGLALAIELAAARLDAFSVGELRQLLDDRFRLLNGHRAGPERHHRLAATIDWSYDLLTESERATMRQLSVFAGAFTLAAARAVAVDDGSDRVRLVEDIANLVAKSLLAAEPGDTEIVYRQFDTMRSYAREKLIAAREFERASRRHAEYCLAIAESAEAVQRPEGIARHGTGIDDIRVALDWAFSAGGDPALGVRLTVAALPFWERLALATECRAACERALEPGARDSRGADADLALRMALGKTLFHTRGPLPEGRAFWQAAFTLAQQTGDAGRQIECLIWLANHGIWAADFRSVLAIADQIEAIAATMDDAGAAEGIDMQAGIALRNLGDFAAARRRLERAVARTPAGPAHGFEFDPRLTAIGALANILWFQGYPDRAIEMARRQREQAEAAKDAVSLCVALLHTSCPLALDAGDFALAGRLLDRVEALTTTNDLRVWHAIATCQRGRLLLERGDGGGLALLRGALPVLRAAGFRIRYPDYLAAYAVGLAQADDADGAHAALDEAVALCEASGQGWYLCELRHARGRVVAAGGARDAAVAHYRAAIRGARAQGVRAWELRAAIDLVELCRRSGGEAEAEALLAAAYGRFDEGFGTRDLVRARALLDEGRADRRAATKRADPAERLAH